MGLGESFYPRPIPPKAGGSQDAGSVLDSPSNSHFLPKTHRILERRFMEFRPFGKDIDGHTIRDMSGVSIRSGHVSP